MPSTTYPRSCVNCYQRKLKCDRHLPCLRCTNRNVQCSFPDSKITRNRTKKSFTPTLHEKVARLEKEVIGIKDAQSNGVTVYAVDISCLRPGHDIYVTDDAGEKALLSKIGRVKIEDKADDASPRKQKLMPENHADASDEEPEPAVPFMLPMFSSMAGGPSSQSMYLPSANDFENFFVLFCERVDPIVRILHKPTVHRLIQRLKAVSANKNKAASRAANFSAVQLFMPEKWSRGALGADEEEVGSPTKYALLMTVAYSATCSLLADDPRLVEWFGETLAGLRKKVTFATEVSLSRLKLYSAKEFMALQAFTLYITTKILDDNSPDVWHTLWCPVALAVSIAHSMNIHKDGYTIGLSPFDTELRRRIWWHLVIMQVRTSENYSCDLFSPDGRGVQLPANISDDEMNVDDSQPYRSREGPSEMTATLLRYEAIVTVAEATQDDNAKVGTEGSKEAFAEKIQKFEERLNTKYLAYARMHPEDERSGLIISLGTIAILKMCWVWGFRLMCQNGQTPQLSPTLSNLSDELFITATRMLEQQIVLNNSSIQKSLYWILRNIKPWDGAAILLSQIKVRLQNDHAGKSYDELPQIIKDAWEVSNKALDSTKSWVVDKELVESLEKMRSQIAGMMKLHATSASDGLFVDLGPLLPMHEMEMNLNGMDLDAEGNAANFNDPWPMFIPMNFNFMRGGL